MMKVNDFQRSHPIIPYEDYLFNLRNQIFIGVD